MQNKDMLFGRRPLIEAIKADKTFDKLFIQKSFSGDLADELLKTAKEYKIVVTKVPIKFFNRYFKKLHSGYKSDNNHSQYKENKSVDCI